MSYPHDPYTAQGIAAARSGNRMEARRLLEYALQHDQNNVTAWWWLAQIADDRTMRHKYLDHARGVASQSDQGLMTYRTLLQQTGAPLLPTYRLASTSRSAGATCPIDTIGLAIGDVVIVCPQCRTAHHVDCWEGNAYHCGNYACDGSGLIDRNSPSRTEAGAAAQQTVVVNEQEIPAASPYQSREQQEAGFIGRLQQQAAAAMTATVLGQLMVADRARRFRAEQARREQEARQKELIDQATKAFLAGLIPGILLAIAVFRSSQDWWMALFTVYLAATGIATAVIQALMAGDRFVSAVYWLLPKVVAALVMIAAFEQWHNGFGAVVLAYVVGVFLTERILRLRLLYNLRALIVFGLLAAAIWVVVRTVTGAPSP